MINLKIIALLIFLASYKISVAQGGNIDIDINLVNGENKNKSSSYGKNHKEFNNYLLFDFISEITKIELSNLILDDNLENKRINAFIKFDNMNEIEIIDKVLLKLEEVFKLKIFSISVKENILLLSIKNKAKLVDCTERNSSITVINRTIKAQCISIDKLIDIIHEWYPVNIYSEIDKNRKYNFELHRSNSFDELVSELELFYGLSFSRDTKSFKKLNIKSMK